MCSRRSCGFAARRRRPDSVGGWVDTGGENIQTDDWHHTDLSVSFWATQARAFNREERS